MASPLRRESQVKVCDSMPFDLASLIAAHRGEASAPHRANVNPKWAKALKLIGFEDTSHFLRAFERVMESLHTVGRPSVDILSRIAVNVVRTRTTDSP